MIHVGLDESNYSPSIAGPCTVAIYRLRSDKQRLPAGIIDSKQTSVSQRIKLWSKLESSGHYIISLAMPSDIELMGVYKARNQAAREAVSRGIMSLTAHQLKKGINLHCDTSLARAFSNAFRKSLEQTFKTKIKLTAKIGGDRWVWAASINAKMVADGFFYGFGTLYSDWGPDFGKGIVRPKDKKMFLSCGPTPFHRAKGYGASWWKKLLKNKDQKTKNDK